jgi:hypothetical protein
MSPAGSVTRTDRRGADRWKWKNDKFVKGEGDRDTGPFKPQRNRGNTCYGARDAVFQQYFTGHRVSIILLPFQSADRSSASRPVSSHCVIEPFCVERGPPCENDVHGTPEFPGNDGERLRTAIPGDQSPMTELGTFVAAKEEAGCLAEDPLQADASDVCVFPVVRLPADS